MDKSRMTLLSTAACSMGLLLPLLLTPKAIGQTTQPTASQPSPSQPSPSQPSPSQPVPSGQSAAGQYPSQRSGTRWKEPDPLDFNEHEGYVSLFDGKTLDGWDGDPVFWRVEDGAIVGESSEEHPLGNTYLSFKKFEATDFDLKLEIKVEKGGGSGIQYRSKTGIPWTRPGKNRPSNLNWLMTGPQADIWYPVNPRGSEYNGQFYSENTPLGIIAWRGEVALSTAGHRPRLMGSIGDRNALGGYVRNNDWNEYTIVARGGTFLHIMNGQLMVAYVDDDPASSNNQPGLIGIELEQTPCKVSVRNIWIRKIK